MNEFEYKFKVKASTQAESVRKMQALASIAAMDVALLEGLASKGPALLNGPYGGMIRKQLGVQG